TAALLTFRTASPLSPPESTMSIVIRLLPITSGTVAVQCGLHSTDMPNALQTLTNTPAAPDAPLAWFFQVIVSSVGAGPPQHCECAPRSRSPDKRRVLQLLE